MHLGDLELNPNPGSLESANVNCIFATPYRLLHARRPYFGPELLRPRQRRSTDLFEAAGLAPAGFANEPDPPSQAGERPFAGAFEKTSPFEFHGCHANRGVFSFGWRYDYGFNKPEQATPIFRVSPACAPDRGRFCVTRRCPRGRSLVVFGPLQASFAPAAQRDMVGLHGAGLARAADPCAAGLAGTIGSIIVCRWIGCAIP